MQVCFIPVQYRHVLIAYFNMDTRYMLKNRRWRKKTQCYKKL